MKSALFLNCSYLVLSHQQFRLSGDLLDCLTKIFPVDLRLVRIQLTKSVFSPGEGMVDLLKKMAGNFRGCFLAVAVKKFLQTIQCQ